MYNPSISLNISLTPTLIDILSLRFPTHYVKVGERNTTITGPPTFKQQCSYSYSSFAFPIDPRMITTKLFGYRIGRLDNSFRHQ